MILCNIQIFWDTEFWIFIFEFSFWIFILNFIFIFIMNLYNIWVSFSEMNDKKYWSLHYIIFF